MRRRKKKSKCPKKNFQSVKRGRKKCKCGISGVRKKKWKENFGGKKNQSVPWEKKKIKIFVAVKS